MLRRIVLIIMFAGLTASPALAQAVAVPPTGDSNTSLLASARAYAARDAAADADAAAPQRFELPRRHSSAWTPGFIALHAATMTTQMLDAHSTIRALENGAVEANPLMAGIANNHGALFAVKIATAAGIVAATHSLSKRNKVAAVLVAVAVNGAYGYVAHHNYKNARLALARQ